MKKIILISFISLVLLSAFKVVDLEIKKYVRIYAKKSAKIFNNQNKNSLKNPKNEYCLNNLLILKTKLFGYNRDSYEFPKKYDKAVYDSIYKISKQDRKKVLEEANRFIINVLKFGIKQNKKLLNQYLDEIIKIWKSELTIEGQKNAKVMLKHYYLRLNYVNNLPYKTRRKLFEGGKQWSALTEIYALQSFAYKKKLLTATTDSVLNHNFNVNFYSKTNTPKTVQAYQFFYRTMKDGGFSWNPSDKTKGYPGIGVSRQDWNHDWMIISIRWATYLSNPQKIWDNKREADIYKDANFKDWKNGMKKASYSIRYLLERI